MERVQPHATCSVHFLALDTWGGAVYREFLLLLGMANWDLGSRMTPWTAPLPPGINLLVGSDHGLAFDCATRLTEILGNNGIATLRVRVNQVTSELAQCKNDCIDMQIGEKKAAD